MMSRLWLALGRSLVVFAATPLVLLISTFGRNINALDHEPDVDKLAALGRYMRRPSLRGVDDPADHLPDWYIAWRILLQNQINRMFLSIEKQSTAQKPEQGGGGVTPGSDTDDGLGFKIHVVGDSTMRMQVTVLAWLLSQRTSADGRNQCFNTVAMDALSSMGMRCTGADQGVDENGNPPADQGFVLSLNYTQVFSACAADDVDADFVYFGCGLHFLQLYPEKDVNRDKLGMWVHYKRELEKAVAFYRSGGGSDGNRIPIGVAFMTTHSLASDRLEGRYATRVREYEDGFEPRLAMCRERVKRQPILHSRWLREFEPEDICTLGILSDSGVANLNERAEEVLDRLGVPIVQGFDITAGQSWATPPRDGRHYPALIPLELSGLLSEIAAAIRRERWAAAV